jgi:hypothetical protein
MFFRNERKDVVILDTLRPLRFLFAFIAVKYSWIFKILFLEKPTCVGYRQTKGVFFIVINR